MASASLRNLSRRLFRIPPRGRLFVPRFERLEERAMPAENSGQAAPVRSPAT
jgi:hypothetical protein